MRGRIGWNINADAALRRVLRKTEVTMQEPPVHRLTPERFVLRAPQHAEARRPPRHLADLAPSERTAAVEALGHKGIPGQAVSRALFRAARRQP
jgi:23S rRNA (adenine2503-C2)-methyltransferase